MATYRGTLHVVLDVEGDDEEEAKTAFVLEMSDFLRHNQWTDLITVDKIPDEPKE